MSGCLFFSRVQRGGPLRPHPEERACVRKAGHACAHLEGWGPPRHEIEIRGWIERLVVSGFASGRNLPHEASTTKENGARGTTSENQILQYW
jgi:hypothetical protein